MKGKNLGFVAAVLLVLAYIGNCTSTGSKVNTAMHPEQKVAAPAPPPQPTDRKLQAEIEKNREKIKKQEIADQKRQAGDNRKTFAKEYERKLLDKGMDVYVTTIGKDCSTLKLKWVLVSRPLVHQICNEDGMMGTLRSLGFKKFILADGYDKSWTITP